MKLLGMPQLFYSIIVIVFIAFIIVIIISIISLSKNEIHDNFS